MRAGFAGPLVSRSGVAVLNDEDAGVVRRGGGSSQHAVFDSWDDYVQTSAEFAYWTDDPNWIQPDDGDPVLSLRCAGLTHLEGAYLDPTDGLILPGSNKNHATVLDEAALDITGDIDVRFRAVATDWTSGAIRALGGKWQATSERSWQLFLSSTGVPFLEWSPDGTYANRVTVNSTSAVGFTDGNPGWVRATLDVDNGAGGYDVTFYTSSDGSSWSQLGSVVTGGSTTSIHSGTDDLYVGSVAAGNVFVWDGSIQRAQVFDGIDGTKVLDIDFTGNDDVNKFTASTGQDVFIVNNHDLANEVSADQPTFRSSVPILNDRSAIQGNAVNHNLQTGNRDNVVTQTWTMVIIGNIAGANGQKTLVDGNDATNRGFIRSRSGPWSIDNGTIVDYTASDDDPHLFYEVANGASTFLAIDGTSLGTGNAGTGGLDGVTIFSNYLGTASTFSSGYIAFLAVFPDDATGDAGWADFIANLADYYGITMAA